MEIEAFNCAIDKVLGQTTSDQQLFNLVTMDQISCPSKKSQWYLIAFFSGKMI